MKRQLALVFGLLLAASLQAGVYYEAKTVGEGGKGVDQQNATVKAWVSGDLAKVEFVASKNPVLEPGAYLLTRDAGNTVYLVNPKDKTYAKYDTEAMMGMAGGMMKMMNLEVSEVKVEKLEQHPGAPVAGIPTVYTKYRTTYRQTMSFMMMKQDNRVEEIQEVWSAPSLVEKALGVWLKPAPKKTGIESYDRLVAAEMAKIPGFPLKVHTVTTTTDKNGKTQTTTVTMEVTTLQTMPMPESTFALPAGYKEISLLPTGEGEEGENPFFGGKRRK